MKKNQFIQASLPRNELYAVMCSQSRGSQIICGQLDMGNKCFTFYTGDGTGIHGPLSIFKTAGDGTEPNFKAFRIDDYGHTVAFGDYEVAAEILL